MQISYEIVPNVHVRQLTLSLRPVLLDSRITETHGTYTQSQEKKNRPHVEEPWIGVMLAPYLPLRSLTTDQNNSVCSLLAFLVPAGCSTWYTGQFRY